MASSHLRSKLAFVPFAVSVRRVQRLCNLRYSCKHDAIPMHGYDMANAMAHARSSLVERSLIALIDKHMTQVGQIPAIIIIDQPNRGG